MRGLYEQLLRSMPEQLERLTKLHSLQNEWNKLEISLHMEKQFNRKVALIAELRKIGANMENLT